jgi:hypothetical protein
MKGRKPYTGINSVLPTTTRITDSVALYLPANVNDDIAATYSPFKTGVLGYLALGGKGMLDKILNEDYAGAADQALTMTERTLISAIKKAGIASAGALTGAEGIQESVDKIFGQTLNPYIEVAFTSMGMRDFSYAFKFTPRSEKETQDVRDIIRLFRFHMAPEMKSSNHRYLTLPSTFDIHYMYQTSMENARENNFYNKIATCVLTGCEVDYTPHGVRSFESGAPTQITMNLSFAETEMLTKQKINEGY